MSLSTAAAMAALPKLFTEFEAGVVLEVTTEPKSLIPAKGVLWAEHIEGASLFLNNPEVDPVGGQSYFPTLQEWLAQPQRYSRILAIESQEWEKADPQRVGRQIFHGEVLQATSSIADSKKIRIGSVY